MASGCMVQFNPVRPNPIPMVNGMRYGWRLIAKGFTVSSSKKDKMKQKLNTRNAVEHC